MTPRVLHVSQATGYGLTRYLSDLLVDQVGRGWEVALATPADVELERTCEALGVPHHAWRARRRPGPGVGLELLRLRRVVAAYAPDIVHLHSSKAGLVGRLVVRGRRPTIFTPHAWSFLADGPLMRLASRPWERFAARWTRVILCVSHAERARGERASVHCRYRVVPNAVDLDAFTPAAPAERDVIRARLGVAGTRLAVCVGRLARQKGQTVLLDVWPVVRERVPDAELAFIGDGPDATCLKARGVAGTRFLGRRDDVRDWLVAADVVVQPSRWEGQSLTTLEAMACGRSVVATAVEGMAEAIGEGSGSSGALVPLDDHAMLTDAIVRRLEDPTLADAEGARSRIRAEKFGLERWGDEIAAVALDALGSA